MQKDVMRIVNYTSLLDVPPESQRAEFAREISGLIVEEYEPMYLKKIIDTKYGFLAQSERDKVLNAALSEVDKDGGDVRGSIYYNRRRSIIEKKLCDYLKTADAFVLEGFIVFRLRDYLDELREVCERAMNKYSIRRDYEEFLELLRFFVSVRTPQEPCVHLLWQEGDIRLLDKRRKDITEKYCLDFLGGIKELDVTKEDAALSALIEIAPETLVLHPPQNPESNKLCETVREVFRGRLKICKGCPLCR